MLWGHTPECVPRPALATSGEDLRPTFVVSYQGPFACLSSRFGEVFARTSPAVEIRFPGRGVGDNQSLVCISAETGSNARRTGNRPNGMTDRQRRPLTWRCEECFLDALPRPLRERTEGRSP